MKAIEACSLILSERTFVEICNSSDGNQRSSEMRSNLQSFHQRETVIRSVFLAVRAFSGASYKGDKFIFRY